MTLKEDFDQHSNFIGGSNARARIACPASWQMEQKLPPTARVSSTYADEGSAIHAAIAHILNNDLDAKDVLGMVFAPYDDYPITQELIDEAIVPCLKFLEASEEPDAGELKFYVEKKVHIPFLPGVFGTCDLIARTNKYSVIGDWKFGVGEKVLAWYEDEIIPQGVPNAQLMFYLLGATYTHPEMFNLNDPNWPIDIFIGQPRYRDGPNFDVATIFVKDVQRFKHQLAEAAREAKTENPRMKMGDHCRFMPCKAICPLHTGPLLEMPDFASSLTKAQLEAAVDGGGGGVAAVDWGSTYRLMLDLASHIEPVLRDWRAQAQTFLEEGGVIPAYKLVSKRASRKWIRPDTSVERRLQREGLTKNERMPRTLISPPQAEKLLKARGKPLPEGYFDAISSGMTLAPDSDPRQAVEPVGDIIASLATALSSLQGWRDYETETETAIAIGENHGR